MTDVSKHLQCSPRLLTAFWNQTSRTIRIARCLSLIRAMTALEQTGMVYGRPYLDYSTKAEVFAAFPSYIGCTAVSMAIETIIAQTTCKRSVINPGPPIESVTTDDF